MTVSIAFNSSIEVSGQWIEFIEDAMQLFKLFDLEITNFWIDSESYHPSTLRSFKRRTRIVEAIKSGETVMSMELYHLPAIYRQAAFDYVLNITRADKYLILTVERDRYHKSFEEQILETLSRYIDANLVEIYEMDKRETPQMYAAKIRPVSPYKTFRLLDSSEVDGSILSNYVGKLDSTDIRVRLC
jgi:hypothetical protein